MEADLQAMTASHRSLSSELGTALMSHLNEEDQNEVILRILLFNMYVNGQLGTII